ncbi:hypothetical protein PVAND_015475 [Polypedilum vanderplanki]|uniref:Uncharacterized protein n=1 Tax=Polypedilum vanderplanki TaxID=319348 RepID=A0A9J6BCX9_POLVA|nr:hypothetical protein PVAND_015475 [Polypedilum vanderplanki]
MAGIKLFVSILTLTIIFSSAFSKPLKCTFRYKQNFYVCFIFDHPNNFDGSQITVDSIEGKHLHDKMNNDVVAVRFVKVKNLGFLPKDLDKFFPNLIGIGTTNANLKELGQNDLKAFKNLKIISFGHNQLTTIEENMFKKNLGLEAIFLSQNPITNIDTDAFEGLSKLKILGLSGLKCREELGIGRNVEGVKKLVEKVKKGACKKASTISIFVEIFKIFFIDEKEEEDEQQFFMNF